MTILSQKNITPPKKGRFFFFFWSEKLKHIIQRWLGLHRPILCWSTVKEKPKIKFIFSTFKQLNSRFEACYSKKKTKLKFFSRRDSVHWHFLFCEYERTNEQQDQVDFFLLVSNKTEPAGAYHQYESRYRRL